MKPVVFSGMRPTGMLHIGHYFGVLRNWVKLQEGHQCWYCIVDWHALTTHYADPGQLAEHCRNVCVDWLAAGIDPEKSTIFLQSHVPMHAELHLALSMLMPLGWLERVPSYKEQIAKLRNLDLATYGFLGYPLLQSADILLYNAQLVPVGADQVAHIEMTREIARRFNNFYGKGEEFSAAADRLRLLLDASGRRQLELAIRAFDESGDPAPGEAFMAGIGHLDAELQSTARQLIAQKGHAILLEPNATVLPEMAKIPGLDGQKMSKSYNNTIALRDDPDRLAAKIATMPTDPARVRLSDPGTPEKCPVWQLHLLYSDAATRKQIHRQCSSAAIGCVACKKLVIEPMIARNNHFTRHAAQYQDKAQIDALLARGAERACDTATATMGRVRRAMGLIASA